MEPFWNIIARFRETCVLSSTCSFVFSISKSINKYLVFAACLILYWVLSTHCQGKATRSLPSRSSWLLEREKGYEDKLIKVLAHHYLNMGYLRLGKPGSWKFTFGNFYRSISPKQVIKQDGNIIHNEFQARHGRYEKFKKQ